MKGSDNARTEQRPNLASDDAFPSYQRCHRDSRHHALESQLNKPPEPSGSRKELDNQPGFGGNMLWLDKDDSASIDKGNGLHGAVW